MTNLNLKCFVKLSPDGRSIIPATLITFVSSPKTYNNTTSTDGIVKLETFDKGKLYQLPLDHITIVDSWDKE